MNTENKPAIAPDRVTPAMPVAPVEVPQKREQKEGEQKVAA